MTHIKETEHYLEFQTIDDNGAIQVRVQKDCSQIQMETGLDDAFFDTDINELKDLRDMLTKVIELKEG